MAIKNKKKIDKFVYIITQTIPTYYLLQYLRNDINLNNNLFKLV